jgi:predicted MFS family arabinose efflux permease
VITNRVLRLPHRRAAGSVDYLGAALLVGGVSALLLVAALGGHTLPWRSPLLLWLAVGGTLLTGLFVLRPATATSPIIPLGLFRSRTLTVVATGGFIVGATMFGAIVFLPVFLQVVTGATATHAGLLMTPLMGGMIAASVVTGRLITRTGRYRIYPLVGTLLMTGAPARHHGRHHHPARGRPVHGGAGDRAGHGDAEPDPRRPERRRR